ncbi:MAG: dockerin type I repeat-containing protein [Candidatus Zixiibacteriota bacterium]
MLKRLTFLFVLVLVVLVWGWPAMAAELATDQAENIVPSAGAKVAGDILWHCDVQSLPVDNLILGIETFRDTFYITGGGNLPHENPNKVHVWIVPGGVCTYLYSVNQPTAPTSWGWRDIACDGQYLYASESRTLECFYVTPAGVVPVPANDIAIIGMADINVVRGVAYDEDNDWFWTADFNSQIYAFDRTGNMTSGPHANIMGPVYGMAYDNSSPGGPWLWVHVQDSTNVYQFNPTTGMPTGVVYSGWGDGDPGVSGIAGGLCVLEGDPSKDKASVTLLGVTQVTTPNPDEMYAMEIYFREDSLYWKPGYENYAPNGMPDIDMWQGFGWWKTETSRATFDGPCAVANCFKWFDSKYEEGFGGMAGDGFDQFPLVRDYMDEMPWYWFLFDDHDPFNINDAWDVNNFTPWLQGGTVPPPPTLQPFVPGVQPSGGALPPWGELVERLAWYLDLDGVQSGYCNHSGTTPQDMHDGIQAWFDSEMFTDSSTLADTLCVNIWPMPTFELVETLVEKCEDMILLLGFWWQEPTGGWWRHGGHWVTVAGINSEDLLIAFSDPFIDNAEYGGRGRVLDGLIIEHTGHPYDHITHNDEGNVSHDIYDVVPDAVSPGGLWEIGDYGTTITPAYIAPRMFNLNVPPEFEQMTAYNDSLWPFIVEVEYAIQVSPWDYRGDVNIVPGGDGVVDVADIVFIVNYLYRGGPTPDPNSEADVTCDGVVNVADIVYLVNYLYKGGPVPRCCDP